MARQIVTITKIIQGIDKELDAVLDSIKNAQDLSKLVGAQHSGKGILYWASYYDPWSMGDSFDLNRLSLKTEELYGDLFKIDLRSEGWAKLPTKSKRNVGASKERWLLTHLHEAYRAFIDENDRAILLLGRYAFGASINDYELLGR